MSTNQETKTLVDGRVYSEKEAAEVLRVTVRTLYNLRRAGQLHSTRVGRKITYTAKHLSDFLARGDSSAAVLPANVRARRTA